MTEPAAHTHADSPRPAEVRLQRAVIPAPLRVAAISAPRAGAAVPVASARASIQMLRRQTASRAAVDPPAPIRSPIAVIRRAPLNVTKVLAAVDSVGYFKGQLDEQTAGQKRDTRPGFADEGVRERVEKILDEHQEMFGKDDAMSMAITIDWVAKVVAEALYDSSLKPAIARHLLEHHKDALKAAMPNKGRRTKDLEKAATIVSTDALSLYLHEERKLGDAAWDIHDAAAGSRLTPEQLFEALHQKFQAEMASFSLGTVQAQVNERVTYNQSESTGNVSANYVKELFGAGVATEPENTMPKQPGGRALAFTPATQAKIDLLRQAVVATTVEGAKDPRPKSAAERRATLFSDLNARDAIVRPSRELAVRTALMADPWGLSQGKADRLIGRLKSGMTSLPLTITHKAKDRIPIDVDVDIDSVDRSRAGRTTDVAVEGRNFPSPGKYTGDPERGEDYMQFRSWKDRTMTGNTGMSGAEMPVFGAVNVNWKKYKATEMTELGDKGQDKAARVDNRAKYVGENYYGGLHLLLDRKRLAGRVVFTATDHGQPHTDPFLAFADFLVGSGGDYQADITRLKREGVPKYEAKFSVQRPEFAQMVVATILGSVKAAAVNLPFEIMVHGGVDWETDVSEIWVSPTVKPQHVAKLQAWSRAQAGRPKVKLIEPPSDGTVSTRAGLAASGVKRAKKL